MAPTEESKHRPLGFWSKALPSSTSNYSPSEKQFLACYWVLVETERLPMGPQVTTCPELSSMSWVLSDPPSHEQGMHCPTPSSGGNNTNVSGSEQSLKQVSYTREWPNIHGHHLATLPPPPPTCTCTWSCRRSQGREVSRCFCKVCGHHQKVISYRTTASLWDSPEGPRGRGSSSGQNLSSAPDRSLCLHVEMSRHRIIYQCVGCGQRLSWSSGTWICESPGKSHRRMTSADENFNNQVDRFKS